MAQPYVSIIIPAYNEAERIPKTLLDMDKRLSHVDYSYEIVVVNDASTDNTAAIVKNMAKMVKNLKILDLPDNVGKGGAVRQGILLSTGTIRLFTDADNSTSIDQFEKMMPFFKEGYEVVIGSRAMKGAVLAPGEPLYRKVLGKAGNLFFQFVLGLWGIWDTQCGFKAFTEEAAEKLFKMATIDGWGFDVEILALAEQMGYKIAEIPVYWVNDNRSHIKASAYLKVFKETITIRYKLWTGKYLNKQLNNTI